MSNRLICDICGKQIDGPYREIRITAENTNHIPVMGVEYRDVCIFCNEKIKALFTAQNKEQKEE